MGDTNPCLHIFPIDAPVAASLNFSAPIHEVPPQWELKPRVPRWKRFRAAEGTLQSQYQSRGDRYIVGKYGNCT